MKTNKVNEYQTKKGQHEHTRRLGYLHETT